MLWVKPAELARVRGRLVDFAEEMFAPLARADLTMLAGLAWALARTRAVPRSLRRRLSDDTVGVPRPKRKADMNGVL